jgi:flavin-dependent dehydrogenase
LRKFSLYAHFEGVDRGSGIEGTLTQMVRARDRWFWIIPITATKTSIGVVLDAQTFKRMKLSPESAFLQRLEENPKIVEQMSNARHVSEVYATGDFSFRNKRFTGERWVLAGDSAGFIDPVWSSGVFIAVLSAEKAADMLDRVLRRPNEKPFPEVRWRFWVFNLLVFLQKRFAIIAPRMSLQPRGIANSP